MKKYKLLKETPESKEGTIFEYREKQEYRGIKNGFPSSLWIPAGYYNEKFIFTGQESAEYFTTNTIEGKPEWFEEVFDNSITLTERQAQIFYSLERFVDSFIVNKEKGSISINRNKEYEIIKEIEGFLTEKIDHPVAREVDNKFHVITADGFYCTDGDKIYGIAIQASGVDQWREQVLPFKTPINESRVWFKDKEKANEYLIANKKCFSLTDIEDEIKLSPTVRIRLEESAKQRI